MSDFKFTGLNSALRKPHEVIAITTFQQRLGNSNHLAGSDPAIAPRDLFDAAHFGAGAIFDHPDEFAGIL